MRPRRRTLERALFLLAILLAYLLGRSQEEERPLPPVSAAVPTSSVAESPALAAIPTSTQACCPCPRPRRPSTLGIARKVKPPVGTGDAAGRDPTEATARYLREQMSTLGACAPATGGEVRVHLEVTVTPRGAVERVRIANLEPPPPGVSSCVEEKVRALKPPGFDAVEPETFALTVVL